MFSRLFGAFLIVFTLIWQPVGLQAEDLSGGDISQFKQIISDQIAAFNADDGVKAYSYAAPTIKLLFPTPDVFMSMVKKGYQPVYRQRSFTFGEVTDQTGRPTQEVTIIDANGGSFVMLAKGNRSKAVTDACQAHGGFYLGSIGGPAARLAQDCIRKVEVLEYPELGMEAIWRIEVENFPAFIVIDDKGNDFFKELNLG